MHESESTSDEVGAWVDGPQPRRKASASGPLKGLRFAAKDLFHLRGHVSGCGSPAWKQTHAPAERDAPVITKLLKAGAELVGMTTMDEMAYSLAGENGHFDTPTNANAEGHVCGGSSSGSAAATAAGLCDFALGTDTGGSIRVPGSYCGLYALRPTHGRISTEGVVPLAPSFDTVGWFARDAQTLTRVGEVLLNTSVKKDARPTHLLVADDAFELMGNAARTHLLAALRTASQKLLLPEEPVRLSDQSLQGWYQAFRRIQGREVWEAHGEWVDRHRPQFGPGVCERFVAAESLSNTGDGIEDDAALREKVVCRLRTLLPEGSVLVLPPAAGPAPKVGADADTLQKFRDNTMRLTCAAGLAGLPQITIPYARVGGLPIGLSLVAAAGQDELLLSTAMALGKPKH